MTDRIKNSDIDTVPTSANPNYALFQISKALTTCESNEDPATRERALKKISKWKDVLNNILTGSMKYGSRIPIEGIPEWATLEVINGGFATGKLLAEDSLQDHEILLLDNISNVPKGEERRALNAYFLSDSGLSALQERLHSGCYEIALPEEGALLVVAWLAENGYNEEARELLDKISPFFPRLRFYPIPLSQPRRFGSRVHIQDVGQTVDELRKIKPNERILAQKEAVEIWVPIYDRIVALFLETIEEEWPCRRYPNDWKKRALDLISEYKELRKKHRYCGKMERTNGHSAQLRKFLARCADEPNSLTGCEVGRIRHILKCYTAKRGTPDSKQCIEQRRSQKSDVSSPTFYAIAAVVIPRLEKFPKLEGLDDVSHLKTDVTKEEADKFNVPKGTIIPSTIKKKVERCLNETIDILVERGLITSGETLAKVLPQLTSGIRAAGIKDLTLHRLYAAIYRAFRCRRSLLLLNLEKQVQIEELPWVAAIDQFRDENISTQDIARQKLEEITILAITSFPHVIIPNKLLQELRALVKSAKMDIPLVDELAADIFMGQFSDKFIESAKKAAKILNGTIYQTYYSIDYNDILTIPKVTKKTKRKWLWKSDGSSTDKFAQLCASRAGVSLGTWDPATNGMIIEQQQILTTQNLATLILDLNLKDSLLVQLSEMIRQCFIWICDRQQVKVDNWHSKLIIIKNTAYAWRQMVFFISLIPNSDVDNFLRWADAYLKKQKEDFQNRFRNVLKGLELAAEGSSIDSASARKSGVRRFLGWSKSKHWLLSDLENKQNKE